MLKARKSIKTTRQILFAVSTLSYHVFETVEVIYIVYVNKVHHEISTNTNIFINSLYVLHIIITSTEIQIDMYCGHSKK
jgi:hypothetical protein